MLNMQIPIELTDESRELLLRQFKERTPLHEILEGATRRELSGVEIIRVWMSQLKMARNHCHSAVKDIEHTIFATTAGWADFIQTRQARWDERGRNAMVKVSSAPVGRAIQLFNGINLDGWQHTGAGAFRVESGMLVAEGGLGLLWYCGRQFRNFELNVDWKVANKSDNSGVFIRFPEPCGDPRVAINRGYEIQIDDEGAPDGAMIHKTGAVYGIRPPTMIASRPTGEWNRFVIRIEGQIYNVTLNGKPVVTNFTGNRLLHGYIGLQNHSPKDQAFFQNVVAVPLS
jgi:hypothetical protein